MRVKRHRLTLQARLMTAVIGFVSLILIIVALITSATLGTSLENNLSNQLKSTATSMEQLVENYTHSLSLTDLASFSAADAVQGKWSSPSLLLATEVYRGSGATGVIVSRDGITELNSDQLTAVAAAIRNAPATNGNPTVAVTIPDVGSYLVTLSSSNGISIVTGLPRDEIQETLGRLFTVIALATLGGLILLALTTMFTIRVSLRPLRAVAATATRVANQPLDRGEVSITERVPESEADPMTETGLVGAALNTLLDHVDASLSARQRNEEQMRRFVADASHELRTPLASIRGYSELSLRALHQVQEDPERDPVEQTVERTTAALERIQAQSLRMTRLVEDLLLLARLDEGTELVYGSVDLTQLALEGITDARPTATDHDWEIDVPEEPVVVLGDAGRLHQVVTNLLANARTHTPAGTVVTIRVSRDGQNAVLQVTDNGPGIDPEVRDQLFARFARGDVSRARKTGGTGLGLAIAKAIVDGHGGAISVDSAPGRTTFTVQLPIMPPVAAPLAPPQPPQA